MRLAGPNPIALGRSQSKRALIGLLAVAALASCSRVYFAGLERIGIPKRDLLQERVENAREAQVEVRTQFSSALERFRATLQADGGELEERYAALNGELERCESRAKRLHERIEAVEDVAEALFDEWESELDQYHRADLRDASARRLEATRARYRPMLAAMKRAHRRIEPVLDALRDIVLALKHQLNARALGEVRGELSRVEREVDALLTAMNGSIGEASKFLSGLDAIETAP